MGHSVPIERGIFAPRRANVSAIHADSDFKHVALLPRHVFSPIFARAPMCEPALAMRAADAATRYGAMSRAIHWITVGLVVVLLLTGLVGDVDPEHPDNATFLWHGSLGYSILVLAILHALAALKHHYVDRDGILVSMLPGVKPRRS
jgi:cytochrome b561